MAAVRRSRLEDATTFGISTSVLVLVAGAEDAQDGGQEVDTSLGRGIVGVGLRGTSKTETHCSTMRHALSLTQQTRVIVVSKQ